MKNFDYDSPRYIDCSKPMRSFTAQKTWMTTIHFPLLFFTIPEIMMHFKILIRLEYIQHQYSPKQKTLIFGYRILICIYVYNIYF